MIRRATPEDCDRIMVIVASAQQALADLSIDQWQDGYPAREVILSDIASGVGYVVCGEDSGIEGYAAIVLDGEPAYSQITPGEWHTADNYVVIHRICVAAESRRHGVALSLIRHAAKIAMQANIFAMRIDTHEGNTRMLAMLEKLGFEYCGKIVYPSGERVAYDRNFSLTKPL